MFKQGFQCAKAAQGQANSRRGVEKVALALAAMVCTAGAALAQPTSTGLQLWLQADAGVESAPGTPAAAGDAVSGWLDQSGNGRHFSNESVVGRPLFQSSVTNGRPALSFNGEDQWLQGVPMPSLGSNGMTVFAVITGADSSSERNQEQAIFADGNWTGAVLQRDTHGDGFLRFYSNWPLGSGSGIAGGSLPVNGFTAHIATAQKVLSNMASLGIDGGTVATSTSGVVVLPHTGGTTYIGTHFQQNVDYSAYHGTIAEILVYDRPLDVDQFNATGSYLAHKYALNTAFPPVPEPGTHALLLVGLWLVGRMASKRKISTPGEPS